MSDSTRVRGLVRLLPFLARFRFPHLFLLLAGLMVLDMVTLDPIPFVDEVILGVLTTMAGVWRADRGAPDKPPEKNVTPGPAG